MTKNAGSAKAARRKKSLEIPAGEKSSHFFRNQLAGEEPLTWNTAGRLYALSTAIVAIRPWTFLNDQDLFLLRDPVSTNLCYCSVMGALGEVFSLHVYQGEESYRFFKRVASGDPINPDDFLASQTGVSVEFVKLSEVTPPDRELLRCFEHPLQRGCGAPIFRALRPGFHPWYVTESEGRTLAECMQALLALTETVVDGEQPSYWEDEDVYPLLVPVGNEGPARKYKIEMVKAPEPAAAPPPPLVIDQAQLGKVRAKDYVLHGAFEADCFYAPIVVGGKNERKSSVRVALISDAGSGFVFKPEIGNSRQSVGELVVNALFQAIDAARFLPAEIYVSSHELESVLDSVAKPLGIAVTLKKSLPAMEMAKDGLFSMMMGMH
jgi:hypothetical protein